MNKYENNTSDNVTKIVKMITIQNLLVISSNLVVPMNITFKINIIIDAIM